MTTLTTEQIQAMLGFTTTDSKTKPDEKNQSSGSMSE